MEEDGRASALRRFSAAVAAHSGLSASAVAMDDWEPLLRAALTVAQRTSPATPLVVIDELPYLLRHSPEIPGLLQHLYDESQFGQPDAPGGRLILCGSAMSVMSELLSGTKPLRGRAILGAMASGASTASGIGGLLGRERGAMTHPLDVLESTGYVTRSEDILRPRKPTLTLTDPIVRFNQLIYLPYAPLVEDGRAADAWSAGRPTFHAKILGPHFEELTRIWTRRHARDEADGLEIGPVGSAEISDAKTRTKHEIDVLALAPGERPHGPRARITLLGEAKATLSPRGPADLERLDRIRTLIGEQGHDVRDTRLALFSLHGFDRNLHAAAAARPDVLLVELSHLYGT